MASFGMKETEGFFREMSERTAVMGILNVTPDSFSDGGLHASVDTAVKAAIEMMEDGADIIDIGGESTRPGAPLVPAEEELARVAPVMETLSAAVEVPISIDTRKADVAEKALELGATVVNDISAMRHDPRMVDVVRDHASDVILMHMAGTPENMQKDPSYPRGIMVELEEFFRERIEFAQSHGIALERLSIDPGIGFGKTLEHNLTIIRELAQLKSLGLPIVVGPSRKSFIGKVLDLEVCERTEGTAAAVALCVANGANVVRVHDVKEMARVARVSDAVVRSATGFQD
ncbi:dihydropteroate synthase [Candidatus Hydrogenedentota bacterium]